MTAAGQNAPAITTTLIVNRLQGQRLLSNSAPCLLINQDSVNAVWIGGDSSTASGNGVQLGALGSVQWAGGDLYGALDVANPGVTVQLTASSKASNPDNPVAVGAAVAAQLLATGVPLVLLQDQILTGLPAIGSGSSLPAPIDVSRYASLTLNGGSGGGGQSVPAWIIEGQWFDEQLTLCGSFIIGTPTDPAGLGHQFPTFEIPVHAKFLQLVNNGNVTFHPWLDGSNRNVDKLRCIDQSGGEFFSGGTTVAVVAGTAYSVGYWSYPLDELATMSFEMFSAAAGHGSGYFYMQDLIGNVMVICDSAEMPQFSDGNRRLIKSNIKVPRTPFHMYFQCTVSSTGATNFIVQGS